MALSKATKRHIDTVADSAATLQLAAEEAARRLTATVTARASERLVARVAIHGGDTARSAVSAAARGIREAQEQLQHEFEAAMLEARSIAREFAMRQVALEAEPLVQTAAHALVLTPSLAPAEVEAMWAQQAGASVARRFGSIAIAETMQWQNGKKPLTALPRALARVQERLEPERKLHAVTQSVGAFNEAKREKWGELREGRAKALPGMPTSPGAGKGGRGTPHPFDDGFRDLWSAILDTKTCPVCWGHDGEMVKTGAPFSEGAKCPLHGHCRCTCITVFIPEELAKYMAGAELDYDALKDDVKDYMGSRKFDVGEGVRHAKRYVDDVLEKRGHSPVVLTERVNNRPAYFPNIVPARAPTLRW